MRRGGSPSKSLHRGGFLWWRGQGGASGGAKLNAVRDSESPLTGEKKQIEG